MNDSSSAQTSCVPPEHLAAFARGALAASRRGEIEAHLTGCDFCRVTVWSCADTDSLPLRRRTWARPLAWAAAASVLIAAAGVFFALRSPGGDRSAGSGAIAPRLLQGDQVLTDGSRLRLEDGARVRALPVGPGERWHLQLEQGAVEIAVAPGRGTARVSSPAGEIRVLGTRFRARSYRIALPCPGEKPFDCLSVRVDEGAVLALSAGGESRVQAAQGAVCVEGRSPVLFQPQGSLDAVLQGFARTLDPASPAPQVLPERRSEAKFLAASYWFDGSPELEGTLKDPFLRKAAEALRKCRRDEVDGAESRN